MFEYLAILGSSAISSKTIRIVFFIYVFLTVFSYSMLCFNDFH